MRKWTIVGLEGLCGDFGYCEPFEAGEAIRRRQRSGEELTEQDVEAIARRYKCRVVWEDEPKISPIWDETNQRYI